MKAKSFIPYLDKQILFQRVKTENYWENVTVTGIDLLRNKLQVSSDSNNEWVNPEWPDETPKVKPHEIKEGNLQN